MASDIRICVVGGVNVDIAGTPFQRFLPGDSNPGTATLSLGGVGRNIAENLARLGAHVQLVTALGDDAFTDWIRKGCTEAGIDMSLSKIVPDCASGLYLCVNDEAGDLYGAVSDMRACDAITPAFLGSRLPALNRADAVVLDANLPEETLVWLASHVSVPMAADTVSLRKCRRLAPCLRSLFLLKPNFAEGSVLAGLTPEEASPQETAALLVRKGVRNVLLSLGERGVWYADGLNADREPCFPGNVVSTNGCGDALFAGALMAMMKDLPLREAARCGLAAASICAGTAAAVNPAMTWASVEAVARSRKTD